MVPTGYHVRPVSKERDAERLKELVSEALGDNLILLKTVGYRHGMRGILLRDKKGDMRLAWVTPDREAVLLGGTFRGPEGNDYGQQVAAQVKRIREWARRRPQGGGPAEQPPAAQRGHGASGAPEAGGASASGSSRPDDTDRPSPQGPPAMGP